MDSPAVYDLNADRRVPFVRTFTIVGVDLTNYQMMRMHVRAVRDTTGTPLIALVPANTMSGVEGLELAYAGTATVADHIVAGRLDEPPGSYEETDTVALSQVRVLIGHTTLGNLPLGRERGDDAVFYYDLILHPANGLADIYLRGRFTVRAGVTIF